MRAKPQRLSTRDLRSLCGIGSFDTCSLPNDDGIR